MYIYIASLLKLIKSSGASSSHEAHLLFTTRDCGCGHNLSPNSAAFPQYFSMVFRQFCVCMLLLWLVLVSADPKKLADSSACYEALGNCDTTDNPLDDDNFPVISDDLLKRATKLQDFKKDKAYFQFKVIGLGEGEAYNYRIYRCGCNPIPENDSIYYPFHPLECTVCG